MHDYSRSDWELDGQRIADKTNSPKVNKNRLEFICLHYTGNNTNSNDTQKLIQNSNGYYQRVRGYSYGYNWVIGKTGDCWEVRGWDYRNAANRGSNVQSVSIQLKVDGQDPANDAMLQRAQRLIGDIRAHVGRDLPVKGHRDVGSTLCPGDGIYHQIVHGYFEPTAKTVSQPAAEPAVAPAGSNTGYPGTPLKNGSRGDAVMLVQDVVGAYKDGWFGPKTEQAVKIWQSQHVDPVRGRPLFVDGIVGPVTWRTMFPF